jgi:hypothetical protein
MDVKQLAMLKRDFLESDFGKIAAQEINNLLQLHYQNAQGDDLEPWKKAYHIERAAGIQEVITWFTADISALEAGMFNEEKDETKT